MISEICFKYIKVIQHQKLKKDHMTSIDIFKRVKQFNT